MAELARAWSALETERARLDGVRIEALIGVDAARDAALSPRLGPLQLDLRKQRLDARALDALLALAAAAGLPDAIAALVRGDPVNRSENRPALHTALRALAPDPGASGAAADAARTVHATLDRMGALVEAIRADRRFTDVIHVGIGGSDLGPRLACAALSHVAADGPRIHFHPNVDAHRLDALMRALDPRRTLVCLVSKSFGTQETLLNGRALRDWLAEAVPASERGDHLVAITANVPAAERFGVPAARVLPMWDWVGGRYSLWSAVGLPLALQSGMDVFRRLLAGAATMDRHYAEAPLRANLPALLALTGIWNRSALGLPTLAVIPYDDRLSLLPGWMQQLDMESNGKRVGPDGRAVARAAAPVIWGEVGTNAQHAFFQSLHQGVDTVPVDFVGVVLPDHDLAANHDALLANLLAQSAAFLRGTRDDELARAAAAVPDPLARDALLAQRRCPGDRPNTVILLDRLTPESFGMLLALYEHKVHAQGVVWGVNSFDQWGVELGKVIANGLLPALGGAPVPSDTDAATAALIAEIRARRG